MIKIHPTAEVSKKAIVGNKTSIWNQAQIREKAKIGKNCIIGKNVYVDFGVIIGNNVKIENNVSIYHGVTIEDGVFIGPHTCFTNDKIPRAINPTGSLKKSTDWNLSKTLVKKVNYSLGYKNWKICFDRRWVSRNKKCSRSRSGLW